jgi:type VI secretion system secreted protein VgrG
VAELEDIGLDQTGRLVSVKYFAPGITKLLVTAFEGVEELSTLPRFRLEVITLGRALKPSEVLGQKLTVELQIRSHKRPFSGIMSSLEVMRSTIRDHFLHSIELVPPAWLLTLNQRCKIFNEKKATDIVAQVLQDAGISSQLKSAGSQREYTVQYCESDFNFIARLLEDEGLFYRFGFEDASCPFITGDGASDFVQMDPQSAEFEVDILSWNPQYRIAASTFKHVDWDFKAVDVVEGNANSLAKTQPPGVPARAFYEFPGRFATADDGKQYARARIEEQETKVVAISGTGTSAMMKAGAKFKVKNHVVDLPAANATADTYALIRVEHRLRDFNGAPFDGVSEYSNDFVCMPTDFAYRPPRVTPRPQIRGPQTATVSDGPDEYGRAKVKFPWFADEQSCWIRVAQSWAFNKMGTQFLPRMNSEVVIEYLEADPDKPLITGMVFNGKNKLLYDLPSNKTQSGVRGSNWGDPGTAGTSNEIRFEDLSGSEDMYVHAQKDFHRIVVNDDSLEVQQGDRKLEIKQGDVTETVDMGDHATKLTQGDLSVELTQGDLTHKLTTGDHSTQLTAGNHEVKLTAGASTIEAMQGITLKCMGNSITIDPSGVTIKGLMVSVEGQVMLSLKGLMTSVNADGMLTLKGAITMVN